MTRRGAFLVPTEIVINDSLIKLTVINETIRMYLEKKTTTKERPHEQAFTTAD
ncbi:hypothetical protein SEA_TILLUMS_14 [Arthrobacter phage Tillums]|nr:hypothetical protein SEA_TILLUMS_14 [Arthrobacter phage Tillums]